MTHCALCLNEIRNPPVTPDLASSQEHVIPFSWYPDSTPQSVQRWTVESHAGCNNAISADEEYVFRKLACVVDPKEPAAAGIWQRAFRGMQPKKGRNEKDQNIRAGVYKKFMRDVVLAEHAPQDMLENAMRGLTNTTLAKSLVTINAEKLDRVLTKIIRLISCKLNGKPPPENAQVKHRMLGMVEFASEGEETFRVGNLYALGDGIIVKHGAVEDRGVHGETIGLLLWKSIVIHAIIYWDLPGKFALSNPLMLD